MPRQQKTFEDFVILFIVSINKMPISLIYIYNNPKKEVYYLLCISEASSYYGLNMKCHPKVCVLMQEHSEVR